MEFRERKDGPAGKQEAVLLTLGPSGPRKGTLTSIVSHSTALGTSRRARSAHTWRQIPHPRRTSVRCIHATTVRPCFRYCWREVRVVQFRDWAHFLRQPNGPG